MRNKIFWIGLLVLLIGFYNCKSSNNSNGNNSDTELENDQNSDSVELKVSDGQDIIIDTSKLVNLIKNVKIQELPYYDSTNFDNSSDYAPMQSDYINILRLEQIFPYDLKSVDKIWIKNRLEISDDFISLVIGFYPGENELYTTLVNYTNDLKLIDFETIAYDEIAESCIRTESYIDREKITKFNIDFCYDQITDTLIYVIKNNGEITHSR